MAGDRSSRAHDRTLVARVLLLLREFTLVADALIALRVGPELTGNADVALLARLAIDGRSRPRDLAASLGLTTGGLSKVVDRLAAEGLVERLAGAIAEDGRAVVIRLTPRGKAVERRITAAVADALHTTEPLLKEVLTLAEELVGGELRGASIPTSARSVSRSGVAVELAHLGMAFGSIIDEVAGRPVACDLSGVLVLAALESEGSLRPRRIGELLRLTSGGVTKLLDRLEADDLVERSPQPLPSDHRAVLIELRPAGRDYLDRVVAALRTSMPRLVSILLDVTRQLTVHARGGPATRRPPGPHRG